MSGQQRVPRIAASCPVCDGDPSRLVSRLDDHYSGEQFEAHRCLECGALYLKDPPVPDRIGEYYRNPIGQTMWKRSNQVFASLNRIALGRDFNFARTLLPPGARVLDLGGGSGAFAAYLADRGYRVEVRDMYAREDWKLEGVPYRQADLNGGFLRPEDIYCDGEAPQLAIMRHVFEHLYSPRKVLELLRETEVPYVLIIVPNTASPFARLFGGNWYYWDPPRHLSFFTQESLREIADRAGYATIAEKTYGIDEIVTSLYRWDLLRIRRRHPDLSPPNAASRLLSRILEPKGILAALSSAMSFPAPTVCWWMGKRR